MSTFEIYREWHREWSAGILMRPVELLFTVEKRSATYKVLPIKRTRYVQVDGQFVNTCWQNHKLLQQPKSDVIGTAQSLSH